MKIILTTLNSKFIHSNLAIRYLKEYVRDIEPVEVLEFTINQTIDSISSEIYKRSPDIVGFSTYIWNIEETLEICQILKLVSPKTKILLGGPEVSFDGADLLEQNPFIDYIIFGEGEEAFSELVRAVSLEDIKGLIYRDCEDVIQINSPRVLIQDLDIIPSPYENIGDEFQNKIVYYESSRGCPFNCEFCLSSTIKGVRYFSLDRVKNDISRLIQGGVSQVKFVDRTFNANKKYSMEIMNYIMNLNPEDINFHFEVTAHLIDDETLEFLKKPKEGLFQFEVGVQSTNKETVKAIGRITDFNRLKDVTSRIKSNKNIHQHLDLIAGLPFESYESFKKSFNDVYSIRSEKIQLGFLKLLKGSGLRINGNKYGYKYLDKPPYEVLENDFISYGEINRLKTIENLVDKYYNEGYFNHSVEFIICNFYKNPFDFYENFSDYWEVNQLDKVSHSRNGLYQIILDFYIANEYIFEDEFKELLKYDYIANNKKLTLPNGINRSEYNISNIELHEVLKNKNLISTYLKDYENVPTKKLINKVLIESFSIDIFELINNKYKPVNNYKIIFILFDYKDRQINRCITSDVTEFVEELIK